MPLSTVRIVLLNAIETGDLPAGDELNNAKGEALALRALCHFNLLITYGKPYFVENGATPGVVLVKNVLSADDLPSRSTVAEGYDMVINDLEEAFEMYRDGSKRRTFQQLGRKRFTGTCQSI